MAAENHGNSHRRFAVWDNDGQNESKAAVGNGWDRFLAAG
jgi:hypothetical protein